MARVKRAVHSKKHRRATLERAKGYYGNKSRSYRAANEQVQHSLNYAFRDRRARKGEFRKLWIQRINAACRENDISYSRFINGLKVAGVEVDRKVLADLAVTDSAAFAALVKVAGEARVSRLSISRCQRLPPSRCRPATHGCAGSGPWPATPGSVGGRRPTWSRDSRWWETRWQRAQPSRRCSSSRPPQAIHC